MLTYSLLRLIRAPFRTGAFFAVLALSVAMCSAGAYMWNTGSQNMKALEDSFFTVATVQQIGDRTILEPVWLTYRDAFIYRQKQVFDTILHTSVLDFSDAAYIKYPKKRPYYGAYSPEFDMGRGVATVPTINILVEASPVIDAIPSKPIRLIIKNVLYGEYIDVGDKLWFCEFYEMEPELMLSENTYVLALNFAPMSMIPGFEDSLDDVYYSELTIAISGEKEGGYEVLAEGYYETERGRRWQELILGLKKQLHTIPVAPTDGTKLLMDFYNGDAWILEGRDISEAEYAEGSHVCLVSRAFARNNALTVGDSLTLPLYYADYKNSIN